MSMTEKEIKAIEDKMGYRIVITTLWELRNPTKETLALGYCEYDRLIFQYNGDMVSQRDPSFPPLKYKHNTEFELISHIYVRDDYPEYSMVVKGIAEQP